MIEANYKLKAYTSKSTKKYSLKSLKKIIDINKVGRKISDEKATSCRSINTTRNKGYMNRILKALLKLLLNRVQIKIVKQVI